MQIKQKEWLEQWKNFQDNELFLFLDWIHPVKLVDFSRKDVLDAGCGGGQHVSFVAPYAKSVTAVDLNSIEVARERNSAGNNITYYENDIAKMDLGRQYDIVYCIGAVHHTDDPDRTVENLKKHVKPGGTLILWVYSKEGNWAVINLVEPAKKIIFSKLSRKSLMVISRAITFLLYLPVYSLYLMPFGFLPYYEYFKNFRKLGFKRNVLNVFDKLNAPQTQFISYKRAQSWLTGEFSQGEINKYKGVSYSIVARNNPANGNK